MTNSSSTQAELPQGAPTVTDAHADLDVFQILVCVSRARKSIAVYAVLAALLGAVLAFALRPTFTATALILPPQQNQSSASAMLGQLGSLASLASGGAVKSPADLYVGILGSRTIADDIVREFNLAALYKEKNREDTRKELKSNTRILATSDGMIHILVDDHSSQRASDIANAYVDELYAMNSHLAITEAGQRRVFFDRELLQERSSLTMAEDELKQVAEKTGVIQLGGQAESIIRSIASLRAQIAAQEVRIQSMRTFATDQNPDQVQAQEEVRALRSQLAQLEKDPRNMNAGSPDFAAGQLPAVSLEYARKLRELKYHEALFELLSKQYEAARIDEAKASPLVQVVDRAVPPDKKSGPPRLLLIFGCAALGVFAACLAALTRELLGRLRQDPTYASRLDAVRYAFQTRSTAPAAESHPV